MQEAIWHLTEGNIASTSTDIVDTDTAAADIKALRSSLRTVLTTLWSSTSSEGTALTHDFFSFLRLALADAAELLEGTASRAKRSLREVEDGVQEGDRDYLGRDKKRLEQEKDAKVQFEHGMDAVKEAGVAVIGTGQEASAAVQDTADRTTTRIQEAFDKVCSFLALLF